MPTHLAFLRAVNVGKRQYRMAQLRAAVEAAGFTDVETYIQTGNLKVTTRMRSAAKVAAALEEVFEQDAGFEVRTIVLSPPELRDIAEEADRLQEEHQPGYGHYVELLATPLSADLAAELAADAAASPRDGERVVVTARAVHLLLDVPYHESRALGSVWKRLGLTTSRNAKVIRTLAQRWA